VRQRFESTLRRTRVRLKRRLARHAILGNRWVRRAGWLFAAALAAAGVLALPFFVLVRTSLWLDRSWGWSAWPAVLGSILLAAGVLFVYARVAARRVTGRARLPRFTRRGLAILVACYALYTVVYLAAANAKGAEVRASYRALHPSLRLAVATLILLDGRALLSDARRVPGDYPRMGLSPLDRSAHYVQEDGWVHALDLRTRGRSPLRNALMGAYFGALGFETLRHHGTADHLHVSLPAPRDRG
jgi:hypothetical protein